MSLQSVVGEECSSFVVEDFANDEDQEEDNWAELVYWVMHNSHDLCQQSISSLLQYFEVNTHVTAYANDSVLVQKLKRQSSLKDVRQETARHRDGNHNNEDNNKVPAYILPNKVSCLQCIQLVNCQLKDINVLFQHVNFPHVRLLNLSFNSLRDFASPAVSQSFVNVRSLDISHNRISSLEFAVHLEQLEILRCHYNLIESLAPLQQLAALEELWLNNNKIEWTQFYHLNSLPRLKALVKLNNPSEEKAKFNEFLVYIVPSLLTVDHDCADKYNCVAKSNAGPGDNMSIDSNNDGGPPSSTAPNKATVDVRVMITQAKAVLKRELVSREDDDGNPMATSRASSKQTMSKSPSKKGLQVNGEGEAVLQQTRGRSASMSSKKEDDANMKRSKSGHILKSDSDDALYVKFNPKHDKSPVAICVKSNQDGYVRWTANGAIACSYENAKLNALHRNGGVAATYDKSTGEGSVFSEDGQLLCAIASHSNTATIVLPGGPDQVVRRNDAKSMTNPHMWEFGDMKVQFIPSTWDLIVSVTNAVGECQFSTISGAQIISSKQAPAPSHTATISTSTNNKKTSSGISKPRSGGIKFDLPPPSSEGKNLASLNADLDIMLANIKNLKSNG